MREIRLKILDGEQAGIGSYVTYIRNVIGGGYADRHYRRIHDIPEVDPKKPKRKKAWTCAEIPLTTFGWGWCSGWRRGPIHAPEFRRKYSSRARPLSVSR